MTLSLPPDRPEVSSRVCPTQSRRVEDSKTLRGPVTETTKMPYEPQGSWETLRRMLRRNLCEIPTKRETPRRWRGVTADNVKCVLE